jgi:hypothetical protein
MIVESMKMEINVDAQDFGAWLFGWFFLASWRLGALAAQSSGFKV